MPLSVRIIHPDRTLFDGQADLLLVPGLKNVLGLLPGHTPMFAELKAGQIELHVSKTDKIENLAIEGGILRIRNDTVLILATPKP